VRGTLAIAAASMALLAPGSAGAASVVNGDYETGDLSGWQVHNSSSGGDWFAYTGSSVASFFPPPSGSWAAVSKEWEADTAILYQDLELEAYRTHRLALIVYYHSFGPIMVPEPNTLATDEAAADNQQLRVDVVRPAAPIQSLAAGDVLTTVFANRDGDPTTMVPKELSADLTPFAGQTVRLRIANAVEGAVFNAGVDEVTIASTVPDNRFGRGRLVRDRSRGTALLAIRVPGPGVLRAGGGRIRAATVRPLAAGAAQIPLRPTAAGRRVLEARGKLRVALRVSFTPYGGAARVRRLAAILRLRP
jgi:hypothetical protein